MAWYTPQWRQALSSRRLRWSASRALAAAAPAVARRWNFYGRGASMADGPRLHRETVTVEQPLRADQAAFIEARCQRFDGGHAPAYWAAPWRFDWDFYGAEDTVFLGHTGRLADPLRGALLTEDGAPENWNRDKLAALQDGAPAEGVALPIRPFSNYFHFLFEVALPLAALLRSETLTAPPVFLAAGKRRPFIEATLAPLAAAHGASLRWVGPRQRVAAARAVVWRRRSPAADWFFAPEQGRAALLQALNLEWTEDAGRPRCGRLLYLTRGAAKLRALGNEAALVRTMTALGADVVDPGALSVSDQAASLQAADVIVAVHGAALANMVFARPGAQVIEIQSAGAEKSVYLALAHQLGLKHHVVTGGPGDARQRFDAPVDAVRAAVEAALEGTTP